MPFVGGRGQSVTARSLTPRLKGEANVSKRLITLVSVLSLILVGCGRFSQSNERKEAWRGAADQSSLSFVLHNAAYSFTSPTSATPQPIPLSPESGDIAAPLNAGTSPVAELSADASTLVFSTWRYYGGPPAEDSPMPSTGTLVAHPSIHAFDLASGVDRVIAEGAISAVVSSDGNVAFVQGDRPDYYANEPFVGSIEVQNLTDPTGSHTLVAKVDNYRLVGWAGEYLLYYIQSEGEVLDLYAMKVDGAPYLLGQGSGVVAISPDNLTVLVQRLGTTESDLALVDIASGKLVARASNLRTPDGLDVGALQMKGDWVGDEVVAAAVTFAGLVYLRISGGEITLEAMNDLGLADFPMGLDGPRFSADGASVVAQAVIPATGPKVDPHATVVTCGRLEDACSAIVPESDYVGAAYPIIHV